MNVSDRDASRVLHGCLREWDYETGVGSFGQDFRVSIPCQLRFTEAPIQDTDRFHEELERRNISPVDSRPDRRATEERAHYDGEVMLAENYNRIKVLVFRGGVVRLFPHDEYVPDRGQLGRLVEALEIGFGAHLEHDPIEREEE